MAGPTERRVIEALSRAFFLAAAGSPLLKRAVSRYGMRGPDSFARRFIGGETVDEVLSTVHTLEKSGFTHTLNYLGEHVTSAEAARTATQAYLQTIEQIGLAGVPCKVSVKLSQLGLEIDRGRCLRNLREIIDLARHHGGFVRIDMEGSGLLDDTLETFAALWSEGHRNVGVVLQSYLHRTEDDLQRVMGMGTRVRLVKGAYKESADIAYREKRDVDAAFARQAKTLLAQGAGPAFATHDPRMIETISRYASENGVGNGGFEFQMLYGVRRDLQASLAARGYGVRIYVPFGQDWFPYFMRRLAERPANVAFVAKSLLYEARG